MDRQAAQVKDATSAKQPMDPAGEALHHQVDVNGSTCRNGSRPRLEAVMDGRLPANAAAWITQYALSLAELTKPVCVVHIYRDTSHLQLVQLPFSQAANAASWYRSLPATPPDSIPGGFFQTVQSLSRHPVKRWLIRLCEPERAPACDILAELKRWTLVLATDNVALAGGYCLLKQLNHQLPPVSHRRIGAVMMGADEPESRRAHWKLNLICAPALGRRVDWLGTYKRIEHAHCTYLGRTPIDKSFWPRLTTAVTTGQEQCDAPYRMSGSPRPPATSSDNQQVENVRCMQERSCGPGRLITTGMDA